MSAPAEKPDAARLDALVADFLAELRAAFPVAFARNPEAWGRKVFRRLGPAFVRHPVRGRPRKRCADVALALLEKQRREMDRGIRPAVDWFSIGCEVLPGFEKSKDPKDQRLLLVTLRSVIRKRQQRERNARNSALHKVLRAGSL